MRQFLFVCSLVLTTTAHANWDCRDAGIDIIKFENGIKLQQAQNGVKGPTLNVTLSGQQLKLCGRVGCWAGDVTVTELAPSLFAYGTLKWDNPDDSGSAHFQLSLDTESGLGSLNGGGNLTPVLCQKSPAPQ